MATGRTDSCSTCYFFDWQRLFLPVVQSAVATGGSPGSIACPNHGYVTNTIIKFDTVGVTNLSTLSFYYVVFIDVNTFELAISPSGAPLTFTGTDTVSFEEIQLGCHYDAPSPPPINTPIATTQWQPVSLDYWCGHFASSNPIIYPGGISGPGYMATSTTSLVTAGSGSKAFTTQTGLAYTKGARIRATSTGTAEWMEGVVTAYAGTTLTVTMDSNSGTGTHTDWDINLAGQPGVNGAPGGMTLLATLTAANSTSLDDTTHITGTYDLYFIQFENLVPVTDNQAFFLSVSTDGGATWHQAAGLFDTTTLNGVSNTAGKGLSGSLYLSGPNQSDRRKIIWGSSTFNQATGVGLTRSLIGDWYDANTVLNGIRIIANSGNISTGKVRIYGLPT